jgi:hypothetical protein
MTLTRIASLFALTLLCGCGISDSTLIADIDESDAAKVCAEFAGYDRIVTCTMGDYSYEINMGMGSEEDCVATWEPAPAGCTATMGDIRDCMDAFAALSDDEICTMEATPPECAGMMDPSCMGDGS